MQDGVEVTLRPLNVKTLRKFMARMQELDTVTSNDESIDVMLDCAAIALAKDQAHYWNSKKIRGPGREKDEEGNAIPLPLGGYTDLFEEAIDMPTVYKIIEVCGGIKLDDPNLIAAATAALTATGKA